MRFRASAERKLRHRGTFPPSRYMRADSPALTGGACICGGLAMQRLLDADGEAALVTKWAKG